MQDQKWKIFASEEGDRSNPMWPVLKISEFTAFRYPEEKANCNQPKAGLPTITQATWVLTSGNLEQVSDTAGVICAWGIAMVTASCVTLKHIATLLDDVMLRCLHCNTLVSEWNVPVSLLRTDCDSTGQ